MPETEVLPRETPIVPDDDDLERTFQSPAYEPEDVPAEEPDEGPAWAPCGGW